MQYFTEEFADFFKELAANNHKDWFHENKKRYETHVKKPFYQFVDDLIAELNKKGESIDFTAKDCVLRINRDIRFSKDKSPYNISYTALISETGRKDKSMPGLYIRFTPEDIGIMGGCYAPSKEQLADIRNEILANPEQFEKAVNDKKFTAKYGSIKGEAHKRVPKEYQEVHKTVPLIANKQFYFHSSAPVELIYSDKLMKTVLDIWDAAQPVHLYLKNIIKK